ncbi:MAG: PHP domain-containing protein [Dehalococcoidia bacterium]|nr:PHP domain-containing protein [Dehalococcoidia bacterium]
MLKADFHIHTRYSMDCHTELDEIIERCQQLGLDCIAISDHDATEGAFKLKEIAPFKVVVAEEILTPSGEVMGLFLKEHIASGLSIERAIDAIRAQGGLVSIPHPFDPLRGLRLNDEGWTRILPQLDILEVFNARCPLERYNLKAKIYAIDHALPGIAGSDAHTIAEIGSTTVELPDFNTPQEFLESLKKARIQGKRSSPFVHFHTTWAKIKKAF